MLTTSLSLPFATSHEVRLTDVTALPAGSGTNRVLHILFRATVLAIAIFFWSVGFVLLTSLLSLPLTLTLWLCGAATMLVGVKADHMAARPPESRP
jgi:hypothetical protein